MITGLLDSMFKRSDEDINKSTIDSDLEYVPVSELRAVYPLSISEEELADIKRVVDDYKVGTGGREKSIRSRIQSRLKRENQVDENDLPAVAAYKRLETQRKNRCRVYLISESDRQHMKTLLSFASKSASNYNVEVLEKVVLSDDNPRTYMLESRYRRLTGDTVI